LIGKMKEGPFYIYGGEYFGRKNFPRGQIVNIVDYEVHPTYGKRYKIEGYIQWFEESCFDYIKSKRK
jgi:hypothetical protein